MGGVWCKADKGHSRPSSPKIPFSTTITRWTYNVRQVYKKPKPPRHRPPRPPQKPLRSNSRLTIGHPQLMPQNSSDGWRTATLTVPEAVPVPPPRKKRKRNPDLSRSAYSMDDLNRPEPINISTISLADRYKSESGLDTKSSHSTLVVTPILEHRNTQEEEVKSQEENKENIMKTPGVQENIMKTPGVQEKIREEDDEDHIPEEIIPIEKETLYSSRTLLHSSLGYVDKLSAISEVSTISTESGFEDRIDLCKSSELSGSLTSTESVPIESGLNILAHIQNINSISQLNEMKKDVREKTAMSKAEWLQNILKEEHEPFYLANRNDSEPKKRLDCELLGRDTVDVSKEPKTITDQNFEYSNRKREAPECESDKKTLPHSPVSDSTLFLTSEPKTQSNHSVLLEILQANKLPEEQTNTLNPFLQKEESIFLKDTKTNIIYKTSSSDKLSEIFDEDYLPEESGELQSKTSSNKSKEEVSEYSSSLENFSSNSKATNLVKNSTSNSSHVNDCFFHSPRLVRSEDKLNIQANKSEDETPTVAASFKFKELVKSQSHESALKNLQIPEELKEKKKSDIVVNGTTSESDSANSPKVEKVHAVEDNINSDKLTTKEQLSKKDSISSSRRSSITDSLHEFELSIYDMLKESKKNKDSSDEEESLKIIKTGTRQ